MEVEKWERGEKEMERRVKEEGRRGATRRKLSEREREREDG